MSGQELLKSKYACPSCYAPVSGKDRKNGYCDDCLHSKDLFPINYKRRPKKKDEEEDEPEY